MIFNSKSKKCCWGIVSEDVVELFRNLCFWVVFSFNSLDFPESHCNGNRSFWPRLGHFDMGCFSLSHERALFTFQPDFFTKLNTSPSVHSYTYINAYTYNYHFQTLAKTTKDRNDSLWKLAKMTNLLNLDETTQDKSTQDQNDPHSAVSHNLIPKKFLSMKLFPSFTELVLFHIIFAFYVVDL